MVYMDNQTTEGKAKRSYTRYDKVLDAPLSQVQRKIAVGLAIADEVKEVARIAGTSEANVYKESENDGIQAASNAAMLAKRKKLGKILALCEDIMARDAETALKYSDKIAAARLYAEATGVLDSDKSNVTNNTLVLDLRQATESELLQELAQLEERKRNVIDVVPQDAA